MAIFEDLYSPVISLWPRLASSIWPHLLAPSLQLLTLTLSPFKHRKLIFAILTAVLAYACFAYPYAYQPTTRSGLSMVWMYHLGNAAKILLYNPEHDFWRTSTDETPSTQQDGKGKGKEHEAERMRFGWEKFKWAFGLLSSFRGVGWNWEVKGVPKTKLVDGKDETREHLLRRMFVNFVFYYLVLDAVTTYMARQHFWSPDQSVAGLGLWKMTVTFMALAVESYSLCWWNYCMTGGLRVLLGNRDPKVSVTQLLSVRYFADESRTGRLHLATSQH